MGDLVSVITTACQQGDWVRKTIPLIRQSLGDCSHEIIVVDDQCTDGSCHGLDKDVIILRTETRMGVSASRRLAVRNASGNLYLFTDPHCQYPDNALSDLVECASSRYAIVLPPTTGKPAVNSVRHGGFLDESERGLKISYARKRPAPWPALLGTIYAVQKRVYDHLGGWPELPGVWGYSEQALSLMAWFSGVPIYVDDRHVCNHQHYHPKVNGHDRFAYRVPLKDSANNGHWVHAAFFPETYHYHWAPVLKQRYRNKPDNWACLSRRGWSSHDPEGGRRRIDKFKNEIANRAVRTEREFFDLVLNKPMPKLEITEEDYIAQQRKRSKPGRTYETVNKRQKRAVNWFLERIPGCVSGRSVLDVGTRTGYTLDMFSEQGCRVEGVELIEETAKFAREQLHRHVEHGDARRLNYPDGTWDLVSCIHTLEHIPQPEVAMRELVRVLKPDGWLLVVVPVEKTPTKRSGHNCAFPDQQSLKNLALKCGLERVVTEEKGLSPKPNREILLCAKKPREN